MSSLQNLQIMLKDKGKKTFWSEKVSGTIRLSYGMEIGIQLRISNNYIYSVKGSN